MKYVLLNGVKRIVNEAVANGNPELVKQNRVATNRLLQLAVTVQLDATTFGSFRADLCFGCERLLSLLMVKPRNQLVFEWQMLTWAEIMLFFSAQVRISFSLSAILSKSIPILA